MYYLFLSTLNSCVFHTPNCVARLFHRSSTNGRSPNDESVLGDIYPLFLCLPYHARIEVMKMKRMMKMKQLTDVFATCGRWRVPIFASLDTITEAEIVVIFTNDLASCRLDSFDSAFRCPRGHYIYGCFEMLGTLLQLESVTKAVYFKINRTSPKTLIPSCTSCTQPLRSSSRAVIGHSGDEERRPSSTQC